MISAAQGAAAVGTLASCDKRTLVGLDQRIPSAPVGFTYKLQTADDKSFGMSLSWTAFNGTDTTGAKSITGINGYNIYRNNILLTSLVQNNYYIDTDIELQQTYSYTLSVVDNMGTESAQSSSLFVPVQPRSYIYSTTNSAATNGSTINQNIVNTMVNNLILAITNAQSVSAAWESLFPSLSTSTIIGIKINTLGGSYVSTKPAVVNAIVSGLTSMLGNTFPIHNIIVFDDRDSSHMNPAGFPLQDNPDQYRIACTNFNTTLNGVPVNTPEPSSSLWGKQVSLSGLPVQLTRIIDAVDYIINVPVLKDHSLAGITFSMKTFYGITDNPGSLHGTMCSPYVPQLYSYALDKVKLTVGDALIVCVNGGPAGPPTGALNTIVAGTDPVALDSWALNTINSKRNAKMQISFSPTGAARYIYAASQAPYSFGSTNVVVNEI